jgi:hypothetical protein
LRDRIPGCPAIRPQINCLRVFVALPDDGRHRVDIYWLAVQKGGAFLIHFDDGQILDVLLDGLDLRHFHFQPKLHDVSREHEDDQQHQHHVHQRDNVDLRERCGTAESAAPSSARRTTG